MITFNQKILYHRALPSQTFGTKKVQTKLGVCSDISGHPFVSGEIKDTILQLTQASDKKEGGKAYVYSVPQNHQIVLRIDRGGANDYNFHEKLESLNSDLKIVPVEYPKKVLDNKNLGLPLCAVVPNSSPLTKVTPQNIDTSSNITLLRKVGGIHSTEPYFNSILQLTSVENFDKFDEILKYLNEESINRMKISFGLPVTIDRIHTATHFLDACKQGSYTRPKGVLGGVADIEFQNVGAFYQNYETFTKNYLSTIDKISKLPQETFNKAVKNITSAKDYRLDFNHAYNTMIDFDKKEINFVDIELRPENFRDFEYKNPVEEFFSVLLGKGATRRCTEPQKLLVYKKDKKQLLEYKRILAEKINHSCQINNVPHFRVNI